MYLFLRRYLSTLVILLIALSGYAMFVVPAIEPPERPIVALPPFSDAWGGEQWWKTLFPEGAWQTSDPQILQSKRGIVLLSKSWVQEGPKTLRLQPLTMILPQGDEQQGEETIRDVLIVSAEHGAVIHLEEEFDPSVSTPSVERGQLSGNIEVRRQVQGKPNEYPWSLRTSDLSLDRSRVFTQQKVVIEWPEGIIVGHDMKLTLQGDLLGSRSGPDSSPWGPLRMLELYHLDQIEAALPPGGIWRSVKVAGPAGQAPLDTMPAKMRLACGGRFTFDFGQSRAMFSGGVQLVHQLAQLSPDEFSSQEVIVDIEPPDRSHGSPLRAANATNSRGTLRGVQIRQIEARGVDSLENIVGERKVELKAPTIDAFASAKRLRIDVLESRVELDGRLDHPGATQSTAWLKYGGYEFTAPRIDYDADGNATSPALAPAHLGYLVASGAGELRMPAHAGTGQALVRWQDALEMRPTDLAGQQWVGLFGSVLVENPMIGYMASDKLEIWLRKNDAVATVPSRPNVAIGNIPSANSQFLPERMRATGTITLDTRQVKAEVQELTLAMNFVSATDPAEASSNGLSLNDSAGHPMYQWLGAPSTADDATIAPRPGTFSSAPQLIGATPSPELAQSPAGPTLDGQGARKKLNPLTVVGSSLNSTVMVAGKESWIDNLTVAGPLDVSSEALGPEQPGWNVVGDELQMATNRAGQVDMQIRGAPARITLGEGSLEGPLIRFDQHSNLIWMDQPGEFTIPPSALVTSQANAQASTSGSINWFEPPHCTWQGRMLFDGRMVRIEGDIRFNGALSTGDDQFWWINGRSDVMQLELSEVVDLDDLQAARAEPTKITVSQNVNILASQLDRSGTKKSRQQLQVPSLTFDISSNELIGLGPGSVRSWHIAKNALGQMASGGTPHVAENLQGAHLIFRESMRGFLDRSELYFQGKAELAAGPLSNWDEAIDLAQMQRLTMNQMHLDCDLLKVYDTSGLSSTASFAAGSEQARKAWEFQAKGNVHFSGKAESGDYEGEGSEVSYVQAKELLTLLGEPRRPARIIKTPADRTSEGTINASVEYAAINPRTLELDYKIGQDGIRVELPGAANNGAGVGSPVGTMAPPPNPRGTVTDFFQRR